MHSTYSSDFAPRNYYYYLFLLMTNFLVMQTWDQEKTVKTDYLSFLPVGTRYFGIKLPSKWQRVIKQFCAFLNQD